MISLTLFGISNLTRRCFIVESMKMIKVLFICITAFLTNVAVETNEYGYFNATILTIKPCQGPKRKDCVTNTLQNVNGNTVKFEMVVNEDVSPNKAKVIASFKGKPMVRLPVKNPCDHFFIKPIMAALFNTTSQCVIKKARYNFNLNMADIFMKYYNGMFLYGNWTFRSMFWSDSCNFFCSLTEVNLYPKDDKEK